MILFHGTRAVFDSFDPRLVGEGAEANSALGTWLATSPHVAAGYAGGGRILVVEFAGRDSCEIDWSADLEDLLMADTDPAPQP